MNDRSPISVLVVDDDPGVVDFLVETFVDAGYEAEGATTGTRALERLDQRRFALVVTDVEMPGMRGLELMRAIHARHADQLVLVITGFGSIDLAVEALRAGACDFLTKPFRDEVLLHAVERAWRERRMRREIVRLRDTLSSQVQEGLVARSPAMRRVVDLATRAAASDLPVLITGESGVGKGAIARYLHQRSDRAGGPFLQINCAALPTALVEAELFGVRRGAFTDARQDRQGLFAQAAGGVLFLDEIGDMPMEVQPKLLQALETGRVRPVGAEAELLLDVRVVAATNRPLEDALRERRFRPDLYYRLNVIRVEVPPLRNRIEDVDQLADLFLHQAVKRTGRTGVIGISEEASRWLRGHSWPGNVRELWNRIERATALTRHDVLLLEDLAGGREAPPPVDWLGSAATERLTLVEIQRRYVERVLASVNGKKAAAARVLGIDRRTLYRWLEEAS